MITTEFATTFAADWIAAWNEHDTDKIIQHYADDVDFTSPLIVNILNKDDGKVNGKPALKSYFQKGLESYPELKFELYHVLSGVNSVVLYYRSVKNLVAAEVFLFNSNGKVHTCICNYKEI